MNHAEEERVRRIWGAAKDLKDTFVIKNNPVHVTGDAAVLHAQPLGYADKAGHAPRATASPQRIPYRAAVPRKSRRRTCGCLLLPLLALVLWLAFSGNLRWLTNPILAAVTGKPQIGISFSRSHPEDFRYWEQVLESNGVEVVPVPLPANAEEADELLAYMDGLILAGGEDVDPSLYGEEASGDHLEIDLARDQGEFLLLASAEKTNLPILGVCRGMQLMNVARGGTLIQDIPTQRPDALVHIDPARAGFVYHEIEVAEHTKLSEMLRFGGIITVNSWHHQSIDALGRGLIVTAKSPDGIIEAIEDPTRPFFLGVEFHPEYLTNADNPMGDALLQAFLRAAR